MDLKNIKYSIRIQDLLDNLSDKHCSAWAIYEDQRFEYMGLSETDDVHSFLLEITKFSKRKDFKYKNAYYGYMNDYILIFFGNSPDLTIKTLSKLTEEQDAINTESVGKLAREAERLGYCIAPKGAITRT